MQRDDWNDMYSGHEEAWTAEPESVLVTEVNLDFPDRPKW